MAKWSFFLLMFCLSGTIALAVSGCESLQKAGVPGMEGYVKPDPVALARENSFRDAFVQSNDHEAFYWLLSNRVQSGMLKAEVEQALGQAGEIETDPRYYKKETHQPTDAAYRWGPDSKGNTVVLFFRDGRLSNFNPRDFAAVDLAKKAKWNSE